MKKKVYNMEHENREVTIQCQEFTFKPTLDNYGMTINFKQQELIKSVLSMAKSLTEDEWEFIKFKMERE